MSNNQQVLIPSFEVNLSELKSRLALLSDNENMRDNPMVASIVIASNIALQSRENIMSFITSTYPTAESMQGVINSLVAMIGQLQTQINYLNGQMVELKTNQKPPQINITNNVPESRPTYEINNQADIILPEKKSPKIQFGYDRHGNITEAVPLE